MSLENDTSKVNLLNEIILELPELDEIISWGKRTDSVANTIEYITGRALAQKNIGIGYYYKGDYFQALEYWKGSLNLYEKSGDKAGVSILNSNIGAIYVIQGSNETALEYFLTSLTVAKEINDQERIGTVLNNIGNIYDNDEDTYDKAIDYYQQALDNGLENQADAIIGSALSGLGGTQYDKGNYDSSIYYLKYSIASYDDALNQSFCFNYLGKNYAAKSRYDSAVFYHEKAIDIARQSDGDLEYTQGLLGAAETYIAFEQYNNAILALKKSMKMAKNIEAKEELRDSYKELSIAYSKISDFTNAFEYQVLYSQVKDSIYIQSNKNSIDLLQFGFDLDQAELEIDNLEKDAEIQEQRARIQKIAGFSIIGIVLIILIALYLRFQFVRKTNKIIEKEKERSDNLLLNILPAETAEELKEHGEAKARSYESVTILFTDFKGFTAIAAKLEPEELVKEIHERYKMFDQIMDRHGIEKIKTIGDAYMAAGGLPVENNTHPDDVVKAAIDIREYMNKVEEEHQAEGKPFFEIRIGVHTGPVVSGIVGTKKFAYDIWGDTVNIAARMESNSEPGKINISQSTYDIISKNYNCEYRGEIEAKNRGMLKMYFVEPLSSGVNQDAQPA
jgi:class 3 adenylate cyclase